VSRRIALTQINRVLAQRTPDAVVVAQECNGRKTRNDRLKKAANTAVYADTIWVYARAVSEMNASLQRSDLR